MNPSGKPDVGNLQVRFDEGDQRMNSLVPTLQPLMMKAAQNRNSTRSTTPSSLDFHGQEII
jgi:hypothetical protein